MLKVNELNGFNVGEAAPAAPLTFTFISITNDDDVDSIVTPTSAAVGDLLIVFMEATSSSISVPGWTNVAQFNRSGFSDYYLVKVADSTADIDMSSYGAIPMVAVYRPNRAITETPTGYDATQVGPTDSNPAAFVLDAADVAAPCFVVAAYFSSGTVNPSTFTGATPNFTENLFGANYVTKGVVFNSSPADITIDMDDEGTNNWIHGVVIYFV